MTPEEINDFYARRGLRTIDSYDRQAVIDSIHENRRRHAREDWMKGVNNAAAMLHKTQREELGDNPDPIDALLHAATMLGAFAAVGLNAMHVVNVLAYLADDMLQAREEASGA